jgi:hypothetical protein
MACCRELVRSSRHRHVGRTHENGSDGPRRRERIVLQTLESDAMLAQ